MVNSEQIKVAFNWINVEKEMKLFRIHGKKMGKTYYITDDEFNRFLNTYPGYKKMWRQYSRNLHSL